jgi:hypothetical protein
MIQKFRDNYRNARVAILGSGPSINLYKGLEDVSIAVNGASFLDKEYHFFMSGDVKAHDRGWWLASDNKNNHVIRVVSSYVAPFDPVLYPDYNVRNLLEEELRMFINLHKNEKYPYAHYFPSLSPEDPHIFFKFGGKGREFVERISPEQEVIYWGGTIAAIALQFSLIIGSNDIHIYGCGFDNFSGDNYYYSGNQKGSINLEQRNIMQLTVDKVRDLGIKVNIHGESFIH